MASLLYRCNQLCNPTFKELLEVIVRHLASAVGVQSIERSK